MPSYDQLDNEAAWRAELAAPGITALRSALLAHYGRGEIGIRGDNNHLAGYHRSRRWIRESRYCTNRTYSVSRTSGDRSGGNENWACAIDIGGIGQTALHAMCRQLDVAVRAGRLEKITEWYGSFGDDGRVDGYDNISNRLASSDSSHLWHLHISFDRGLAGGDHSDLLAVLIGDGDDDMSAQAEQEIHSIFQAVFQGGGSCGTWRSPKNGQPPSNSVIQKLDWLAEQQLSTLAAKLDALTAVIEQLAEAIRNGGGTVDTAAILAGVGERLAALRTAVEADTRDAVADAAEGGAEAVRADA